MTEEPQIKGAFYIFCIFQAIRVGLLLIRSGYLPLAARPDGPIFEVNIALYDRSAVDGCVPPLFRAAPSSAGSW
jgi:hypothetical protein